MTKGRARIAVGQGISVWLLDAPEGFGDAGFHAHHAIQITVCLKGHLRLATETAEASGHAIAVRADTRHRFEAHGLLAFIFVEPESAIGRTLTAKLFGTDALCEIGHAQFLSAIERCRDLIDSPDAQGAMIEIGNEALHALAPITCTRAPDDRVLRIIDYASQHLDEPLTFERAAAGIYLSGSRLRHLFVEQTGLAFRTYLLWLRLVRAVQIYSEGRSLTAAAHDAGFADSAHFSRIFKRTFGLPATTLTRL